MSKEFRLFCVVDGVAGLAFALLFLTAPGQGLSIFGMAAEPATLVMTRIAGAQLFAWGLVMLMYRNEQPSRALATFLLCFGGADLLMAAAFLHAQLNGVVNVVGSAVVVICTVFGTLFFLFARRANRAEPFVPR